MAIDATALYCCLDDFRKAFEDWEAHRLVPSQTTRQRAGKLSRSEMLFIMALFHLSAFKHFKAFHHYGVGRQHRACFGDLPHYDRVVSLMPRLLAPLMALLHSMSGEHTGIYFADSAKLAVCHDRRIHRHKAFDGLAARGKTGMGWFYGLKLHAVINHKGQIVGLRITPGNAADSTALDEMTRRLAGKLYADEGYIGQALFKALRQRGLHLITGIRRNMKNYLAPLPTSSCGPSALSSRPCSIPSSPKWGWSVRATGRRPTPWCMSSPASLPTPSGRANPPSRQSAQTAVLIRSWSKQSLELGAIKACGSSMFVVGHAQSVQDPIAISHWQRHAIQPHQQFGLGCRAAIHV